MMEGAVMRPKKALAGNVIIIPTGIANVKILRNGS